MNRPYLIWIIMGICLVAVAEFTMIYGAHHG
jgi:hypothetical protein